MFSSLYENLLTIITGYTVCLQLYVFYLVKYKSPRNMKGYRYFLNTFTFWDLCFTVLLGFFLQPVGMLPYVAATVQGFSKYLGKEAGMITASLVFYAGTNVITYQNLCVFYRYTILHSNKMVHNIFMSLYAKFAYGFLVQLLSGFLGYHMYFSMTPQWKIPYYMPSFFLYKHNLKAQADDTIIHLDMFYIHNIGFLAGVVFLFLLSELSSIILVFLILRILRQNVNVLSHNALKVHRQFTILLLSQLLIPIVCVFFPVCTCFVAIVIGRPMSATSIDVGFLLLSSYGAVNSIFTIIFVSNYRWHFYNTFILPWLLPVCNLMGLDGKLPKQAPQPEAPPTTTDQGVKRNKIDVCGAGLQLV